MLAVREFFKLDYRGLEQLLLEWSDLRSVLELKKVPDHSNLHRAALRLLQKKGWTPSCKAPSAARGRAA
jgi:hypothetical protein